MEGRGREGGIEEWPKKKKGNKYIFMFTGMSATPSIPTAGVIGKVRRGESGTHPGRGWVAEYRNRRGENDVATTSGSRFLLSLCEVCACVMSIHS